MEAGYDGRNSLYAHLPRWVQMYGTQPAWMHTVLLIGNRNNKQEWAKWGCKWRSMIGPSAPNIIHREAFDKVCKVMNMVHHVRHTDLDLHVPAVLWAYRTTCKTLTAWALRKLKYEARAIIHMNHAKPSPCVASPIDTMVCEAQNEGTT